MRFAAVLILLAISFCTFADDLPKFPYLAGYTDVQVLKVNHRGIQILHNSGSCYLNVNDLSEYDKRRLAKEIEIFKVRKKEYDAQQAKLKKQRAADAKKQKAELKKQTDAQNKEISALVKQFSKKNVYDTLIFFEKKFGIYLSNRHLGLRGRVKSVVIQIEKHWPLAKKVKQSYQPKPAKEIKVTITKDKDGNDVKSPKETTIAPKEPPVLMNQLSQSIVLKRIALEDKIFNKAKGKLKAAEDATKDAKGGKKETPAEDAPAEDAPAEDAPEEGEENQEQ